MQVTNTCMKQEKVHTSEQMMTHSWMNYFFNDIPSLPFMDKTALESLRERGGENMPTAISCQLNAHTVWEAFVLVVVEIPHRALRSVSLLWDESVDLSLNICRWDQIHSVSPYKHLFKLTGVAHYKQHQQHNAVCEASANINY